MKSPRFACLLVVVMSTIVVAQTNPVPLINQPLVPDVAAPGGLGFTLTVNGTGFVSGCVVNWNGSARATTFVNGSQVTTTIAGSDVANPSTAAVTVMNPPPGGGISNTVFFSTTNRTPSVTLSTSTVAMGNLAFVAVGDLDSDGKLDLVVSDEGSHAISVQLGNGDGTFQNPHTYSTGDTPFKIAIADLNGDGNADVVVTHNFSTIISVFLGNGDGTLQPSVDYEVGSQPFTPIVADFNRDGIPDLAVTNANAVSDSISILLGNGDGTFQSQTVLPAGQNPDTLVAGDFDEDGILDLAVTDSGANSVLILRGRGDGTFENLGSFGTGSFPRVIVAADFNGDGYLDLANVNSANSGGATSISVLLGNGNGTFKTAVLYGTGDIFLSIVTGDFNGDGKLDLAAVDYNNNLAIFLGNGDGTFQPQVNFSIGGPVSLSYGDFNGDGRLDFVAPTNYSDLNSGVSILLQTPAVSVAPPNLSFGNQNVGTSSTPQNVTMTNTGSAILKISSVAITGANSGDFSQQNNCGSNLKAGASCTIAVTFRPTAPGSRSASVNVSDNAPNSPQSVPLTGVGIAPLVTLSPASFNFGNQTVNIISSPQISTLTNTGNGTLNITSIAVTGANSNDFTEKNNCGKSVPAGGSCQISVTFKPSGTGSESASVTIADNAPDSPQSIPLSGVGVLPAVTFSPTGLTFPTQVVFTSSKAQQVTLTNAGLGVLKITAGGIAGQFGRTTNCTPTIAAGASCTINVTFRPLTKGTLNGAISITDNAPGSPQTVPLTGTGTYVQLNPTSVNFGTQPIHTTSLPKYITLTNKGSATVNFTGTGITITGINAGDFAQINNCGNSVSSGASCHIKVTFTPSAQGKRTAAVSISDDGGGSPQTVPLTGTGTP